MTNPIRLFPFLFLAVFLTHPRCLADETTHPNNMIPFPAEITWQEGKLPLNVPFQLTPNGE